MTRAASGPELRWRSCAALPRRTSPTFETLWSSTRVMRMLSRSPNPSLCVYTFIYCTYTRYTEHGTRRGAGGQNSLPIRRASSGYGSLVGSFVRARFAKIEARSTIYSNYIYSSTIFFYSVLYVDTCLTVGLTRARLRVRPQSVVAREARVQ